MCLAVWFRRRQDQPWQCGPKWSDHLANLNQGDGLPIPVEAVIWDLDDTLVVERPAAEAAMVATCRHAAAVLSVDPDQLEQDVFDEAKSQWSSLPTIEFARRVGIASWEALWATFEGPGEELGDLRAVRLSHRQAVWREAIERQTTVDPHTVEKLSERFVAERINRMEAYPDAEPVISQLQPEVPMAIVTNGAPDTQRTKLSLTGLDRFSLPTVVAGEIGIGKPSPEPFLLALDQLGVAPEQAVFVGDSVTRDINPALNLGMAALLIARHPDDPHPITLSEGRCNVISTLHEVHQYLSPRMD